jgi:LDH2 family malate/lactate/ureidoglycolate dehydrogenase
MIRRSAQQLTAFAGDVLRAGGVPGGHADITARRLVEADLRGRTGHGLIRLAPYVARIEAGGVNLTPVITAQHETPVSALIDGDNGLGQVVMTHATEVAITKARASGLAWVGTVRSNHAGAAGLYAEMAADAGLIGIYLAVANSNGMPPWGGTNPILGTNPIAIAIPTENHPFVLDIASTVASHGSIKVAAQQGTSLPEGWVVDAAGRPITDPARADEGFLVPMGGYKGAGLTIAFGLLAGVLNGAAFGAEVIDHRKELSTPTNTGQAIMVLRADLFRPQDDVLSALTGHLSALRNSGTEDGGPVRLPGDGAAATRGDNERHGIPVPAKLAEDLDALARRLRVESPFTEEEIS